ncbi:MAG: hypothetical protein JWN70_904 [Planctomycetaceae bacterium]|nr:hypothetical protein [Planctomycetaceae bacterium]
MSSTMDWVTVETFWSVEEAQVVIGFLDAEDIRCRLEGEVVTGNLWPLLSSTGGVKLLVTRHTAERAASLLTAAREQREMESPSETDSEQEQFESDSISVRVDDGLPSETVSGGHLLDDDDDENHPSLFDRLREQRIWVYLLYLMPLFMIVVVIAVGFVNIVLWPFSWIGSVFGGSDKQLREPTAPDSGSTPN